MSPGFVRRRVAAIPFDVAGAVIGFTIAALLFPLRFVLDQIYIRTIPLILGTACLLYLYTAYRDTQRVSGLPTLSLGAHRSLSLALVAGVAALVVIAVHAGKRSLLFYDVAGVLGTLQFVQIAFSADEDFDRNRALVLSQIVLLAGVVRFAALYTTPGLIGIDIWTHITQLAGDIYATGTLESISNNKYSMSPLYHLLVVATALLGDVSLRLGLYLSLGIVMPISVLVVYATANLLVDDRWAALAALLYSFADYVIEWGIHLIPTSMGLVFFLAVLYWLLRVMRTESSRRAFWLLVAFTVAVVLTHQVSTFIMLVLLGAGLCAYVVLRLSVFRTSQLDPDVFRTKEPVNIAGLLAFDAGLSTFLWSFTPYNGNSFLVTVLSYLQETLASSAGVLNLAGPESTGGAAAGGGGTTLIEKIATYVDTVGFLLLLFGTFVGCLYVINRRRARQSPMTLLVSSAVMLVFVLGFPMFGIRSFIPARWFAFLYAPMVVLTAIGLRHFTMSLGHRSVVAILLVFALVFPSVMVMSSNGAIDNPVFEDQNAQLAYSEPEIAAVYTIGRITGSPDGDNIRPDQVLYTDHPYQTLFDRTDSYPTDTAVMNDSQPVTHDIVVYRREQSRAATYFVNSRGYGEIRNVPRSRVCRPTQAVVYTNRYVMMCVESPATST